MRRKSSYGYSNYGRKRRVNWRKILVFVGIPVLVVVLLIAFNFSRIKLMFKGYSFSDASVVLKQSKEIKNELLSKDKVKYLNDWLALDLSAQYYDEYDQYLDLYPEMSKEDVVETMKSFMEKKYASLQGLGYTEEQIWNILADASMEDVDYLITNSYKMDTIERFKKYKYFSYQKLGDYLTAASEYGSDEYAVNITNFPFILSTNATNAHYEITKPDDELALVKKGFYLPGSYVPSDLVVPNVPNAPDNLDNKIRQVVATALEKMVSDASKQNMHLVLNSGYRSFDEQTKVYNETEATYGGIYAAEYVALPGASEHQTGLGVDITSQSVVDGERITLSDTEEYDWLLNNCYKYGFIVRFEEGSADITGIAHEPWHFRYVGEEAAKMIHNKKWTFEEYCLNTSTLPEFEYE